MLFTISGASGSGKSSLVRFVLEKYPDVHRIVTCTTREPRAKEVDGVDYHFVSSEFFKKNANNIVGHEVFGGNHYGFLASELIEAINKEALYIVILDKKGALKLRDLYADNWNKVHSIYLQISKEDAYKRLRRRDGAKKARARQKIDEEEGLFDWHGFDCVLDGKSRTGAIAKDVLNYYTAMIYQRELDVQNQAREGKYL